MDGDEWHIVLGGIEIKSDDFEFKHKKGWMLKLISTCSDKMNNVHERSFLKDENTTNIDNR